MVILVVDDEVAPRESIARAVRQWGHEAVMAGSADAALAVLEQRRVAGVICDQQMPGRRGMDLLPLALARDPDLAIVLLLDTIDARTATEAHMRGALGLAVKPVDLEELKETLREALRRRVLLMEQRRVDQLVRDEVAVHTAQLERDKLALRGMSIDIVETLINAMEAKDVYLRGHSQRVADLGAATAQAYGLDDDTVEHVRLAGRLHDVGKIGIREGVLNKPGKLSAEEYAHVKEHVRIGMEILAPLRHIGVALDYVHDHHEHWDGGGYPRGLAGEAISIGGRILAAADAFDALTSRRAYREPMGREQTIDFLANFAGHQLDVTVFEALREVILGVGALEYLDDRHA